MSLFFFLLCAGICCGSVWAEGVSEAVITNESVAEISLMDSIAEVISLMKSYDQPIDNQAVRLATINAMVREIDPLGRVISADEFEQMKVSNEGGVQAVGVEVAWSTNESLQVVSVYPETSAEKMGLLAGDIIDVIEDSAATNLTMLQIKKMLRGPIGQTVHLKVIKADGITPEYDVERNLVPITGIDWTEQFPEQIAYIRLNGIYEETGKELVEQLLRWETGEVFGVIMDLRDARGQNLYSILEIGSLFAHAGDLLYVIRDKEDQDIAVCNAVEDGTLSMPVMTLLNTNTCGAAEVLAAVLKGSTRGALLIGQPSAGDFIIREPLKLSSGEYLYITTRKMVVSDGTTYDGTGGVKPDIVTKISTVYGKDYDPGSHREVTLDEEKEDKWLRERVQGDPILHRAVNLILGLKALDMRTGD